MHHFFVFVPLFSLFFLSACGSGSSTPEKEGTIGINGTLTQLSGAATVEECHNGGVTLEHGIDKNADGSLSSDEIIKTYVICHGQNADVTALQAELNGLNDKIAALETKLEDLTSNVALKADATALAIGLALKADATALASGLALKADATTLASGLALKADTTALTSGLALKADATALTSALSDKADKSTIGAPSDAANAGTLFAAVNANAASLGDATNPANGTVWGRLGLAEVSLGTVSGKVDDIEDVLNDTDDDSLYGRLGATESDLTSLASAVGEPNNQETDTLWGKFEGARFDLNGVMEELGDIDGSNGGIHAQINAHYDAISANTSALGGNVLPASCDTQVDEDWTPVMLDLAQSVNAMPGSDNPANIQLDSSDPGNPGASASAKVIIPPGGGRVNFGIVAGDVVPPEFKFIIVYPNGGEVADGVWSAATGFPLISQEEYNIQSSELAPGEHTIRFEYTAQGQVLVVEPKVIQFSYQVNANLVYNPNAVEGDGAWVCDHTTLKGIYATKGWTTDHFWAADDMIEDAPNMISLMNGEKLNSMANKMSVNYSSMDNREWLHFETNVFFEQLTGFQERAGFIKGADVLFGDSIRYWSAGLYCDGVIDEWEAHDDGVSCSAEGDTNTLVGTLQP
jgi:hypothetical protein